VFGLFGYVGGFVEVGGYLVCVFGDLSADLGGVGGRSGDGYNVDATALI
jgi:hypothetical protein